MSVKTKYLLKISFQNKRKTSIETNSLLNRYILQQLYKYGTFLLSLSLQSLFMFILSLKGFFFVLSPDYFYYLVRDHLYIMVGAIYNGPLTKTTFYVQFLKANFLEIKPLKGEFMDTYPLSYFSNGGIWRCFALIAYLGDHLNEGISDF